VREGLRAQDWPPVTGVPVNFRGTERAVSAHGNRIIIICADDPDTTSRMARGCQRSPAAPLSGMGQFAAEQTRKQRREPRHKNQLIPLVV